MIPQLVMVFPFLVPFLLSLFADPGPGIAVSKSVARQTECREVTRDEAEALRPGELREEAPRGDFFERTYMTCDSAVLKSGTRPTSQDALLAELEQNARRIAVAAKSANPDVTAWYVDAHLEDGALARKLNSALKNALMLERATVNDAALARSGDDVLRIRAAEPQNRPNIACSQIPASGLARGSAILAATQLDPSETILHAGVCRDGGWSWLL